MRFLIILCFIFTLPILGVLGYDAYHFYEVRQVNPTAPFNFSEIGFLWVNYSKETHDKAIEKAYSEFGSDSWQDKIKPALRLPAVYYAVGLAGVFYVLTFLVWFFVIRPDGRSRKVKGHSSAFSSYVHDKKSFRYKRK